MSGGAILAYRERESWHPETGVLGILRDEWRIARREDIGDSFLRFRFGTAYVGQSYVLLHRYIRRGTEEAWECVDVSDDPLALMSNVDDRATPVDPVFADYCRMRDEQRAREKAQQEAEEAERRERERRRVRREQSEEAFRRMLQGAPRNRELAERWNAHVERLAPRAEELAQDAAFRATYDAVIAAVDVPSKARAIREHLAKWDSLSASARPGGAVPIGNLSRYVDSV